MMASANEILSLPEAIEAIKAQHPLYSKVDARAAMIVEPWQEDIARECLIEEVVNGMIAVKASRDSYGGLVFKSLVYGHEEDCTCPGCVYMRTKS